MVKPVIVPGDLFLPGMFFFSALSDAYSLSVFGVAVKALSPLCPPVHGQLSLAQALQGSQQSRRLGMKWVSI